MSWFSRAKVTAVALTAVVSAGLWGAGPAAADPPAPPGTPTATAFDGTPTVGPLFSNGLDQDHGCTASVVASPGRNLILTAAHCVSGTAAGLLFVPGYDRGRAPHGVWTVTGAYVDPRWAVGQDPQHDYAILTVADRRIAGREAGVEDVTGGSLLGPAPAPHRRVTDVAYNAGIDDRPVRCTTSVYYTDGFPSFNCHGYVGGSSGSPWLVTVPGTRSTYVTGIIAGLHQGGCYEYTSYSPSFTPDVYTLLARAASGARPDHVPVAGSDGC